MTMTIAEVGSFAIPHDFLALAAERATIHEYLTAHLPGDIEIDWQIKVPPFRATIYRAPTLPNRVTLDDILSAVQSCEDYEFVLGLGAELRPVIVSLNDDSPHIACSAGSGAGKSTLAKILAVQVLHRGGRVYIIDRKGSHKWAVGLPGVTYCLRPDAMHGVLIGLAGLADQRNTDAFIREEGWDPGPRVLVIVEELNSTLSLLQDYWEEIKEKGQRAISPAIRSFREISHMGRSAKIHLFGVAQMLTARAVGGPEARENFGIRCLSRYSANNWKMLAPQCPMPRRPGVLGRWQVVVGDVVTATQVANANSAEARAFVLAGSPADVELVPMSYVSPLLSPGRTGGTWDMGQGDQGSWLVGNDAAAQHLGIPVATFRKRRQATRWGEVPGIQYRDGQPMWRAEDLDTWTDRSVAEQSEKVTT